MLNLCTLSKLVSKGKSFGDKSQSLTEIYPCKIPIQIIKCDDLFKSVRGAYLFLNVRFFAYFRFSLLKLLKVQL